MSHNRKMTRDEAESVWGFALFIRWAQGYLSCKRRSAEPAVQQQGLLLPLVGLILVPAGARQLGSQ
jgi:hypothetical protein